MDKKEEIIIKPYLCKMQKKILALLSSLALALWYLSIGLSSSSCAQIVSPTGGERDTIAPILDTLLSSPNMQINFEKSDLIFHFDEFLELASPQQQVIVTPPLDKKFSMELKKFKSVIFRFSEEEVLKENVTYSINFGKAIKDFTEGNVFEYSYVFSTGDYIDSLSLSGQLLDAFEGEPQEDVLIMLYTNKADSVVRTEKPFYFARTNESGRFQLNNLKADTFKVAALKDNNLNYIYDQEAESIGFMEQLIITSDSLTQLPVIRLFQEEPALKIMDKNLKQKSFASVKFNKKIYDLEVSANNFEKAEYQIEDDELLLWYTQNGTESGQLILQSGAFSDTLYVDSSKKTIDQERHKLSRPNTNMIQNMLLPDTDLILSFKEPVTPTDSFLVHIYADSILLDSIQSYRVDSTDSRNILLTLSKDTFGVKSMVLMPGSFTSLDNKSQDSTLIKYKIAEEEILSGLILKVNNLDSTFVYRASLSKKGEEVFSFDINNKSSFEVTVKPLFPGDYQLTLIEDKNENGRWDTGNYDEKTQAEYRKVFNIEKLRANWEVESLIDWQQP